MPLIAPAIRYSSSSVAKMPKINHVSPKIVRTKYHDVNYALDNRQVPYPLHEDVLGMMNYLGEKPVVASERDTNKLLVEMAQVNQGEKIIVQAGLCAENMDALVKKGSSAVKSYAVSLVNMSNILSKTMTRETGLPTVNIVRGAGQLGKPRSKPTDPDGTIAFHGHLTNSDKPYDRIPRVKRMDVTHSFSTDVRRFMSCNGGKSIYTSSEWLHGPYTDAMMRGKHCGVSNFGWAGMRTNDLESDQINRIANVSNPVGIKVSNDMKPKELKALIKKINADDVPGKLTLIFRMGAENVDKKLKPLLKVVKQYQDSIVAIVDPMHGNTKTDEETGLKTREVKDIVYEAVSFARQCNEMGLKADGIHLEVNPIELESTSAEPVTECRGLNVQKLQKENYKTLVDPCLNMGQAKYIVKAFAQARSGNYEMAMAA